MKEQEHFVSALKNLLIEMGAKSTGQFYEFVLDTKAGPLHMGVSPNLTQDGATVFSYFENVDNAKEVLPSYIGMNQYSGKWNHHFFTKNIDESVNRLKSMLLWVVK